MPGRLTPGLRERKKAKTRAAIQRHALRLFHEQGYAETTVEQIAAAAEVSPSTFFRYFPTKEAVVFTDEYDAPMLAAFKAQPPDVGPMEAVRNCIKSVMEGLSEEERESERTRVELLLSVPELRAAMMADVTEWVVTMAEVIAERSGRRPDEFETRAFAGALVGMAIAAALAWQDDPSVEFFGLMDRALAFLQAGLPL
ncbi:MAG TPA: TetR family transcriptional regulator [Pseudonocardiaceae bacterium]